MDEATEATALVDDSRGTAAAEQLVRAAEGDQVVELDCCSICLLGLEEEDACCTLQPCGHSFHKACIDRWFHSCIEVNSGRRLGRAGLLGKLACPNCRQCPTLSTAEAERIFPGAPGAPDMLEHLDASPTASPELAHLSEVVRRVQRASETRDPSTGRIRFFRPEDGPFTIVGKVAMYAVLFVPATGYFLVRRALIPGCYHLVVQLRDAIVRLPPPPDILALLDQAGRAVYSAVLRPCHRGVTAALQITADTVTRAARATKYYAYDCVLAPAGVAMRDRVLVPLRDGGVWTLRRARDGAVYLTRKTCEGIVYLALGTRDHVLLPTREGGLWLLRTVRDRLLVPAKNGVVFLLGKTRDGGAYLLRAARDRLLVPLRDGVVSLLSAARHYVLLPLKDGLMLLLRKGGAAVGAAARWAWRTVLVPTGRGVLLISRVLWRGFSTAAVGLGRVAFRGVTHAVLSLLEVGYVLRDLLASGLCHLKYGARFCAGALLAGARAAFVPVKVVAVALAAAASTVGGAVGAAATALVRAVVSAATLVGGGITLGACAVHEHTLRPAFQAACAAVAAIGVGTAALARALKDYMLSPLAAAGKQAAAALATQAMAVLRAIHAAVLLPLLEALKLGMRSAAEAGAAAWAELTAASTAVAAAVRTLGAQLGAAMEQAWVAASAAMRQAQRDVASMLRALYQLLEKLARGKAI